MSAGKSFRKRRGGDYILDFGFYKMDCMDGMKHFPDKYFELAIVDPPYGINVANMNMGAGKGKRCSNIAYRGWTNKDWDIGIPDDAYFQELFRVSKHQIIWGGNYFNLPPCKCFIVWDKAESMYGRSFSECEMAWTNLNATTRIFKCSPLDKSRIHPTQKPIALYTWILQNYANRGDRILDTHVGSASSLIACHRMGFRYVGFELDADYYRQASERLERERAQISIFTQETVNISQETFF